MTHWESVSTPPTWHRYAAYVNGKLIDLLLYPEQVTPKVKYWKSRKAIITVIDRESKLNAS